MFIKACLSIPELSVGREGGVGAQTCAVMSAHIPLMPPPPTPPAGSAAALFTPEGRVQTETHKQS